MLTLREILAKKNELKAKGLAILNAAKEREDKTLTAEEQTEYDGIMSKIEGLESEAKLLADAQELERVAGSAAFRDDPPPAITVHDRVEDDPTGGFKSNAEFFSAVRAVGNGRVVDERLYKYAIQGDDEQSTTQDPYGGFLVPRSVMPGLMTVDPDDDPLDSLTMKVPMATSKLDVNARVDKNHATSVSGGLVVSRRPETQDGGATRMKFEQITLTLTELFGVTFVSARVMRDSPGAFPALISQGMSQEFSSHKFSERLQGSGTGEPLGVLSPANGSLVTIAKEGSQAADTIVKGNIDKMVARHYKYGRGTWVANYNCLSQLLAMEDTGGTLTQYFKMSDGGSMTLLGRPLFLTEYCEPLGDKGDIVLGNWGEYLDGERGGVESASSMHVRFLANEEAFKFWMENDGKPWWTAPLTQKTGTVTRSPFVALANRA